MVNGTVELTGDYACTVEFNSLSILVGLVLPVIINPEDRPPAYTGTMTVTSKGVEPFSFNPYHPLIVGVDVP